MQSKFQDRGAFFPLRKYFFTSKKVTREYFFSGSTYWRLHRRFFEEIQYILIWATKYKHPYFANFYLIYEFVPSKFDLMMSKIASIESWNESRHPWKKSFKYIKMSPHSPDYLKAINFRPK